MDTMTTHGAFSWNELMTTDPEAAKRFYGELFGWTFGTTPTPEGPYYGAKVKDTEVAGLMNIPRGAEGLPPMWSCYVTVDDVDKTLGAVERLGGKVVAPPMEVPEVGRIAVIQDPQGATLNIVTYVKR